MVAQQNALLIQASQPVALGLATGSAVSLCKLLLMLRREKVGRIAEAITVRIEGATQGSGVLVQKEAYSYTVLTAWHVVKDHRPGEELAVNTSSDHEYQLEPGTIRRIGNLDLAVLKFKSSKSYPIALLGRVDNLNYDKVFVAGFPSYQSTSLRLESGLVVANADVGIDQGYQLYDNKTFPGMSGGVILDSQSRLVGIHGR